MRNRLIAEWTCAMIFFIAAVGCNKDTASPDNPDPNPEPRPVPPATRMDVSIKGTFNPFVCDDASAPEVCAQWKDGDVVYAIGSTDGSKLDTLGILTAKVLPETGDRSARLTGSMAIPAADTKISLLCGPALSEAPTVDERGTVSVSLASQGGYSDSFTFVAYAAADYAAGAYTKEVIFEYATGLLRLSVNGLSPDLPINNAILNPVQTACKLTFAADASPVAQGQASGPIVRDFLNFSSDALGSESFYVAVPKISAEANRRIVVNQQGTCCEHFLVPTSLSSGKILYVSSFVTDLSANGTANCYIVEKAGDYRFKATVKGNGYNPDGSVAEPIAPTSAEVLWETFGTDDVPAAGDLIREVSLDGGYVKFTSTTLKGNALIAVRDADSTILWSWHIWLTDEPDEQVYKNNAGTLMDRNLGAVSPNPEDGVLTFGLLYQWGRKDPFLGSGASASGVSLNTVSGPIDLAESAAIPTTFITGTWTEQSDALWGSSKTMYDPCPAGWRVPDGGDSGVWKMADFSNSGTWDAVNKGMNFSILQENGGSAWYPATGYRFYSSGGFSDAKSGGHYWSNNLNNTSLPYGLYFKNTSIAPVNTGVIGHARAVRCQQLSE